MIDKFGRVVLMDFGVARSLDSSHLTQVGMAIGTPEAMAPEQVRGQDVGPAADIYALGVLTYRLLAGRPPFTGNTTAVLFAHVQEPPPPLAQLRPDLPAAVYRVVESALAKEPWQRPISAGAFAAALSEAVETAEASGTSEATGPAPPPTQVHISQSVAVPEETDTVELPALTLPELPSAPPAPPVATIPAQPAATTPAPPIAATPAPLMAPAPVQPARRGPPKLLFAAIAAVGILGLVIAGWAVTRQPEADEVDVQPAATAAAGPQLVTVTIAGDGSPGIFNRPGSVAVDSTGRVYVADEQNHRIRFITPERSITTLAGSGSAGFADGQGAGAEFDSPFGLAVDSSGKVFVADTYNGRIRTITREGVVSTLAGAGPAGFADGPADYAQFSSPTSVAVDSSGNVYVADFHNHRVRKILTNGTVTTLAGSGRRGSADGLRNTAEFDGPRGVAVDAEGNVYVADLDNNRIRKVEPNGAVTTVAGTGEDGFADGPAGEAQFSEPGGVAVDAAGNIYVADGGNRRVRKVTPDGEVMTVAGSGEQGSRDGAALEAQFGAPVGIALDAAGNIYVSDLTTHRVRIITPEPTR
jgi:sugar lactone lactonase YvrE